MFSFHTERPLIFKDSQLLWQRWQSVPQNSMRRTAHVQLKTIEPAVVVRGDCQNDRAILWMFKARISLKSLLL